MSNSRYAAGVGFGKNGLSRRNSKRPGCRRLDSAVIEALEGRVLFSDAAFVRPPGAGPISITQIAGGPAITFNILTSGTTHNTLSEIGSTSLPTNDSFTDNGDDTATISGSATGAAGGVYPVTFQASNSTGGGAPATQVYDITVEQSPAITSAATTSVTAGTGGTFPVTAAGFAAPTFSLLGTPPTGVSINSSTGLLTVTSAAVAGLDNLVIAAANAAGTTTQGFALDVNQTPAFTGTAAATFTTTASGSATITTTGFPLATITESGSLDGLTFSGPTGTGSATISGNPTAGTGGTDTVTLFASNGVGVGATETYTLTIDEPASITSTNAATFTVGNTLTTFNITTGANDFPKTGVETLGETGALPSGLTFADTGNGTATISGIAAAGTGGSYALTLSANNGIGSPSTQAFTLTVGQAPTITSRDSTAFAVGVSSSFTISTNASSFPAGPTLTLTNTNSSSNPLPAGLTFHDNGNGTATISGTPQAKTAGVYGLQITASNGVTPAATQAFQLTVGGRRAPSISSAASLTVLTGDPVSFAFVTHGTPTATLNLGGTLPAGLTFTDNHDGTGTLTGTPTSTSGGFFVLPFTVSNGVGNNAIQAFRLTVIQPLVFTSAGTASFTVGTATTFNIATTGFPSNATISLGGHLPAGLTFSGSKNGTATISGTPKVGSGGAYDLTVTAQTSVATVRQHFVLTVHEAPSLKGVTSALTEVMTVNKPFNKSFVLDGSPTPVSIVSGSISGLPAGLTLVASGGNLTLSGTPTATGLSVVTFTLENSDATPLTTDETIDINVKSK